MTAPESAPDAAEALAEVLRLPLIDALEPFADGEPFDEQELVDNLLLPAARAALSPALDAVKAEARAELAADFTHRATVYEAHPEHDTDRYIHGYSIAMRVAANIALGSTADTNPGGAK